MGAVNVRAARSGDPTPGGIRTRSANRHVRGAGWRTAQEVSRRNGNTWYSLSTLLKI
jgi:hypothetical protein